MEASPSTLHSPPHRHGCRTTPSYVAFTDCGRQFGDAAKHHMAINPTNTVFNAKRLIGRKFSDPDVQADAKYWPFSLVEGPGDKPLVQVAYNGETKRFHAEEICAMVLDKMKEVAEAYLDMKVTHAVIAVPARFNMSQRQAIKDASTISGLYILRIIDEPVAAAITYGLDMTDGEKNVLVFDMGGGNLSVSLLTMEDDIFEVKATAGDTHLGGVDFDNRLIDYCITDFKRKHPARDPSTSARAKSRLRTACERAKRSLSTSQHAIIEIDSLFDGRDYSTIITRELFEELCSADFSKLIDPVTEVLGISGISKTDVHEVVLVGGSTRIPRIRSMLTAYFSKGVCTSINPDEAVAFGATVQAAIFTHADKVGKLDKTLLLDVTPLSLGMSNTGGAMETIIPRNTTVPTLKSQTMTTDADDQTSVQVNVFEGDSSMVEDNLFLGQLRLDGIPPMPKGQAQIEVTFDISTNGILRASAVEKSSGREMKAAMKHFVNCVSPDSLQVLMARADMLRAEDACAKRRIEAKTALELYVVSVKNALKDEHAAGLLSEEEKRAASEVVDDAAAWLDAKQYGDRELYEAKHAALRGKLDSIAIIAQGRGEGAADGTQRRAATAAGACADAGGV